MYYNLLSQIKNATMARKDKIVVPFSRMDFAIATILAGASYIKGVEKETVNKKSVMVIRLSAKKRTEPIEFTVMSKPSRHLYRDYRSLHTVKQGHGLAVLSTSKGIMTQQEARKKKVGGEYLFEIW
jgi:small subunit ribosomal protein S8